ncbi:PIN domain-containing protein [Candidatus Daviesbacteria bacterium]|nr:PIN domain-containing protein [Candidatus Daviesbacteria bacterium]
MKRKKVFLDSDVIISSLISDKGAAYFIIHETDLQSFVSNKSIEELEQVCDRLGLNKDKLAEVVKEKLNVVQLKEVKKSFKNYTLDLDDVHIIAGVKKAKAKYLLSYNTKDFKIDKIIQELKIVVTTPARFLQYLRSLQ